MEVDYEYGSTPRAFFMKYLQGPVSYISGETFIDNNSNGLFDNEIDTPLDTAYQSAEEIYLIQSFPGAKHLNIFRKYFNAVVEIR